jgi:hypothetical protein
VNTTIWNPYWQALHAYSLTAVIRPTTFAGYTWRVTTAGTSGATEPTWPNPLLTPTIVDGTVTWSADTAFRQQTQAAILTLVTAFKAANPTIVRSVASVRPGSFAGTASLPVFYIGDMSESYAYVGQVWQRTMAGLTCYLVDQLGTVGDSNDRMNFAHDVLADLFTVNFHAISPRSILQLSAINDFEFEDLGPAYPALQFIFGSTNMQEGRT